MGLPAKVGRLPDRQQVLPTREDCPTDMKALRQARAAKSVDRAPPLDFGPNAPGLLGKRFVEGRGELHGARNPRASEIGTTVTLSAALAGAPRVEMLPDG
ncbi:hypothetical protein EKD16_25080 (plasmid) [Streptomonospora litoralis]|uniref:Uncharacterized protein n=1 Tax=Streptomonospora litoralis TaxID=2498135 RepID=A0A4P6QBF1_9ACTN|nr:hypothetical protein EKD16_25080 [Streptomonospora litoralis]